MYINLSSYWSKIIEASGKFNSNPIKSIRKKIRYNLFHISVLHEFVVSSGSGQGRFGSSIRLFTLDKVLFTIGSGSVFFYPKTRKISDSKPVRPDKGKNSAYKSLGFLLRQTNKLGKSNMEG